MVPLKQKETVILFNTFLLEATPLPSTNIINSAVLKSLEGGFIMVCPFLQQSTLSGKFLQTGGTSQLQRSVVSRVSRAHKWRVWGGESRGREWELVISCFGQSRPHTIIVENIKQPYEGMHWFLLYKKQFRTDYPAILNLKNINLINKICLLKYNMISQLVIKHNTVFIPLKTIYRGYVIVLTSPV